MDAAQRFAANEPLESFDPERELAKGQGALGG